MASASGAGKPDIKSLFPEAVVAHLTALGAPAFRGKQVFAWLHRRFVTDFAAMTDLPAELRETLAARFTLTALQTQAAETAADGTTKYLFTLADGNTVETVYIPEPSRATICLSTQVGCAFGCTFCATGQGGFVRNLTAGEIVDQVYRVAAGLPADRRITNIVYMGMGEPLSNYDEVLRSVRLFTHPLGMDLAQRRITISTVGLVPGIERLADEGLQVNLAISLHAPTQQGRLRLLPIARKYELEAVVAAARQYVRRTGRKVTFQYTVVPGSNDSVADAQALAELVRGLQCLVNIIPLNPTEGLPAGMRLERKELIAHAEHFEKLLRERHVEVALRRSRGQEVSGACGQLRRRAATGEALRKRP